VPGTFLDYGQHSQKPRNLIIGHSLHFLLKCHEKAADGCLYVLAATAAAAVGREEATKCFFRDALSVSSAKRKQALHGQGTFRLWRLPAGMCVQNPSKSGSFGRHPAPVGRSPLHTTFRCRKATRSATLVQWLTAGLHDCL
jgi:hypothetical protein